MKKSMFLLTLILGLMLMVSCGDSTTVPKEEIANTSTKEIVDTTKTPIVIDTTLNTTKNSEKK